MVIIMYEVVEFRHCSGCCGDENCQEQEGKDVFEYSVFGSPNQKIGKFANQKSLGEWS